MEGTHSFKMNALTAQTLNEIQHICWSATPMEETHTSKWKVAIAVTLKQRPSHQATRNSNGRHPYLLMEFFH
jgi:hypothetical protein